ncbi:hypothetical protein DMC30DRAFT_221830 [Rhodotorula diobovata]|uniref:Uncharacterized protein n=1 Tax=Rhodotorula diobovata TaxID=5288 RepID=A0A5C5FWC0_9BASI|nr:hypothetical protein DMC30DRAFT_221830 [Rhodotorula diobovata]
MGRSPRRRLASREGSRSTRTPGRLRPRKSRSARETRAADSARGGRTIGRDEHPELDVLDHALGRDLVLLRLRRLDRDRDPNGLVIALGLVFVLLVACVRGDFGGEWQSRPDERECGAEEEKGRDRLRHAAQCQLALARGRTTRERQRSQADRRTRACSVVDAP